jgi:hypothetical protein
LVNVHTPALDRFFANGLGRRLTLDHRTVISGRLRPHRCCKKRSTRNYAPLLVEGPLKEKKRPSGRETIAFPARFELQAAQGGLRAA